MAAYRSVWGVDVLKIGEFSRFSRVSIRMLRHYDHVGLLKPTSLDPDNGYRLYAAAQLSEVHKITKLRDIGFRIEDIKRLGTLDEGEFLEALALHEEEIVAEIEQGKRRVALLSDLRNSITSNRDEMHYEMELKAVEAFNAVSIRMTIPSYSDEHCAWEALGVYIKKHAITVSDPYREICEFHHEGATGDIVVEVVVGVEDVFPDEGPIRFFRTKAYERVASIMVYGPYENIAPVYASFAAWLEEHPALRVGGNTREIAHKGCWNTASPEGYLTEFQIPVTVRA